MMPFLLILVLFPLAWPLQARRQMQTLGRGMVAVPGAELLWNCRGEVTSQGRPSSINWADWRQKVD